MRNRKTCCFLIQENPLASSLFKQNCWEIDQVTSKRQMNILDKTCRSKTENYTTIEFCILELV